MFCLCFFSVTITATAAITITNMPRLPTTPVVTDEATITTEAAESVGGIGCIVVEEGAWEEVVGEIKVSISFASHRL